MASIRISTALWPIVVHTTEGSPSDADIDEYILQATALLAKGQTHAAIMDCTKAGMISGYARKRTLEWVAEHEELLRRQCVGTAYVFSSPALRFIFSSFMLLRPHPTPYLVCETVDEAKAWARRQLREAGVF
jgi:hypothetical protein